MASPFLLITVVFSVILCCCQAELTKFTTQVEKAPWRARAIPAGGLYNGTFYVMGGRNHIVHMESDIWKSSDGLHWDKVKGFAEWGARSYMDTVFLKNGTMVLIGGQDLTKCFSDVWVSHDFAQTWTKILDNAPWGRSHDGKQVGRSAYKTLVLEDDTILLFSGDYGAFSKRSFFADVWASYNGGLDWEIRFDASSLPAGTPSWAPRAGMQVVKIGSTIYFMGGDNDDYSTFTFKRFNDIWKSEDLGKSWEFVRIAPWGNRTGHQCVSVDNQCIHCIGGQGCPACNKGKNLLYSDIWKTCDGAKTWERIANGLFGCDPDKECDNCGADDMLTRIADDGKVWMMGADREKSAPFPMSNSVWTLEDDAKPTAPLNGVYCFKLNIPFVVNIHHNVTVVSNTTLHYGFHVVDHLDPSKSTSINCPSIPYVFDVATGAMDITHQLKDKSSCLSKVRVADDNTTVFTFTWTGKSVQLADDEKTPELLPYSGAVCPGTSATASGATLLV